MTVLVAGAYRDLPYLSVMHNATKGARWISLLSVFTSRKGQLCFAEHLDNLDRSMDCVGVSMTWSDQLAHVLAT